MSILISREEILGMQCKELIKILERMPPDCDVMIPGTNGNMTPNLLVFDASDERQIWITAMDSAVDYREIQLDEHRM